MKKMMVLLVLSVSLSTFARNNDDFHSLIVESAEARSALSQKLKKSADVMEANRLDELKRQEKVVISETELPVENVAVPSAGLRTSLKTKTTKSASKMETQKLERLSQEVDESRE